MCVRLWISCTAVLVFSVVPGLMFGQSKTGIRPAPTATNPATPTEHTDPSGRNELGGVGPILPYGNDALPSGGTFANSTNSNRPTLAKSRLSAASRRAARPRPQAAPNGSTEEFLPHTWNGTPSPVKPVVRPRRAITGRSR
jgi:hypothetical protein